MRSRWFSISLTVGVLSVFGCGGSSPVADPVLDDTGSSTEGGSDTSADDTSSTGDTSPTDGPGTETSLTDTGVTPDTIVPDTTTGHVIKTVWVIAMENHSWSTIKASPSAAYINGTLAKNFAHAEQYFTPPGNHPSEPNYLWMEAGDNLGIKDDGEPSANHQATKDHFVTKLQAASITWKSYQEGMPDPTKCPLASSGLYATKHNPMIFFDDVTTPASNCIAHIRPYPELATDLTAGTVAAYNFVSPNLCNDMHGETFGATCPTFGSDLIKKGDDFLAALIPKIQASKQYKDGGAIFVVWDEGDATFGSSTDGPLGMIVVSPFAKSAYSNSTKYTHSSLLRTLQVIFSVSPFIRAAASTVDLGDLFKTFP